MENTNEIFNNIFNKYDLLNRILSFGMDFKWRKKLNKYIPKKNNIFLVDLACGTADQIIALSNNKYIENVLGVDISKNMLLIAKKKNN